MSVETNINLPHFCQDCADGTHDPGVEFWTTAAYDRDVRKMFGPFETHQEAINLIPAAATMLHDDWRSPWLKFGTVGIRP